MFGSHGSKGESDMRYLKNDVNYTIHVATIAIFKFFDDTILSKMHNQRIFVWVESKQCMLS